MNSKQELLSHLVEQLTRDDDGLSAKLIEMMKDERKAHNEQMERALGTFQSFAERSNEQFLALIDLKTREVDSRLRRIEGAAVAGGSGPETSNLAVGGGDGSTFDSEKPKVSKVTRSEVLADANGQQPLNFGPRPG